jgi:hypothetical protein
VPALPIRVVIPAPLELLGPRATYQRGEQGDNPLGMGLDGILSGGTDVGDVRPAGELLRADEGAGAVRFVLDPVVDVRPGLDPDKLDAGKLAPEKLDREELDGVDTPLDGNMPFDGDTAVDEESGDPSPFEEDVPSELVDPIGRAAPRLDGPAGRDDRDDRDGRLDEDGDGVVPLVIGLPNVVMDAPALGLQGSCRGVGVCGGPTGEVGLCIDPGVWAAGFVEGDDAGFVWVWPASAAEANARLR